MVTETEVRESTAFESYVERTLPPQLREGAAIPAGWTGGADEWAVLADAAREEFRRRALYDFTFSVAVQGWTVQELATGDLAHGSEVKLTGEVKRPAPSKISRELELAARRALAELQARRLTLDPSLQVTLEGAASGTYSSEAGGVIAAIKAATAACDLRDRERSRGSEEQATKVRVRVREVCGFGRKWTLAVHDWSPEDLAEAEKHHDKVHSNAGGRSLASIGHRICPPWEAVKAD